MDNPAPQATTPASGAPEPQQLKTRTDDVAAGGATPQESGANPATPPKKPARRTYRPSHRATFLGLAVVTAILAVNAVIFIFVLKKQATQDELSKESVTLSTEQLNKLGINRSTLGSTGVQLTVAPNAQFKGTLSVDGKTTLSGAVLINNKLSGTEATFTKLQAGDTSLSKLNVNGDGTLSTLNLRKDLAVAGITQLQGAVTINSLLTVKNNLVVQGNLSIGGTFSARSLAAASTLVIGGHVITTGPTPGVSRGGATGSNGTVAISGSDASGVVSINTGVGAGSGLLATVSFVNAYSTTPEVVISAVGSGANFYLGSVTSSGFTIYVSGSLAPGGYRVNYIAEQ